MVSGWVVASLDFRRISEGKFHWQIKKKKEKSLKITKKSNFPSPGLEPGPYG